MICSSYHMFWSIRSHDLFILSYVLVHPFTCLHTHRNTLFPKKSILTKKSWNNVEPWRKQEAYVTVTRFYLGCDNFKKWSKFLWTDYVHRQRLIMTYKTRHLSISDGSHPDALSIIPDLQSWSEPSPLQKTPRRKKTPDIVEKFTGIKRKVKWNRRTLTFEPEDSEDCSPPKRSRESQS